MEDGLNVGPDPFSVGLRLDSSAGPADCCTPLSLQRVGIHEVKRPMQMLQVAAHWMMRELFTVEPEVLDNDQSCPKELAEDANLHALDESFRGILFMITRTGGIKLGRLYESQHLTHLTPQW